MNQASEEIAALLSKAQDKLKTARMNFEGGQYDDCVSRSYYAVFHAVTAVLLDKGLVYSSHSQVIGAFNRDFVKTGIFPTDFTSMIQELYDGRQVGDYDPMSDITREDAEKALLNAESIVSSFSSHLNV